MKAPSYLEKKQHILTTLPLLAVWASGLYVLLKSDGSMASRAAMAAWYICLTAVLYYAGRKIASAHRELLCAHSNAKIHTELNRMKNQSYVNLSHEMKTPLTVISVNAQLAAKNLEAGVLDEETITDIRIIAAEASRLSQMVSSFVGLGQLQGTGIEYTSFSPDTLVRTTARTFQPLAARFGNTLTVIADPHLPPVYGNADRLIQVLVNLLNNANRHTRNGSISISVKCMESQTEISVTDNGEGIDPNLLPHVFERFCRGDKGHTGLGLSICKLIIDEHGGDMGIESQAGQGTRVWFRLPTDKND